MGPRTGPDRRKISPPPGFDPRTVQPVAQSLYRLCYSVHNKTILLAAMFRLSHVLLGSLYNSLFFQSENICFHFKEGDKMHCL